MAIPGLQVSARRIVDGRLRSGKPTDLGSIGIVHCGRDKGSLFVVVDVQGKLRDAVEQDMVDRITTHYYRSTASLTGALTAAIKEANSFLYDQNQDAMPDEQTRAGVYCAVLRPGQQMVLGYAGPSVGLVSGPAGVEYLPSDIHPAIVEAAGRPPVVNNTLGVKPTVEPVLWKTDFEPGDMLVLGSPSLYAISDEEMRNALHEEGVDGLPANVDGTVLAVLYQSEAAVEVAAEEPEDQPAAALAAATGAPARPTEGQASQPATPAAAPLPGWLASGAPAPAPARPRRGLPALQLPSFSFRITWIFALLAVVLLIAAAAWWRGETQRQETDKRFQALMAQAQEKRTLGQASIDRSQAITFLKDAETLVGQALDLKKDDPNALALRDNLRRDADQARGITRLEPFQVTVLTTFTAPASNPARVVGDGANLYVLDRGDQKVHRFVVTAQGNGLQPSGDSVIIRKGDQIGGVVVGELMDMAWIPQGGARTRSALVVLESGGSLIEYDVQRGARVLPVRDARTWRKAQATGGYGGNFYLLDPIADTILRYRPDSRGYDSAPTPYLQTKVDLTNAVDMAIDGDIFVLLVNGQVVWLSAGKPQPFPLDGLDRPMAAPVALFTNEGTQSVFVADPGNARIVQVSKQGVIQRQFIYEDAQGGFQRARGLFVDENKHSLYVTAGTKLLHVTLP